MKKFLLILMTMMMCLGSLTLSAQTTLTVADGYETNSYVPVYGFYADAYLRSQTIYPSSMLSQMSGQAITSMTFYLDEIPSANWGCDFQVKLTEVVNSDFSSTSFINDLATTVYTGPLNIVGDSMTVDLAIPFNYSGGNLLLEIVSIDVGLYSACSYYGIYSEYASICGYSYSDVSDVYPTIEDFIPKTKYSFGAPTLCIKPHSLSIAQLTSTEATICWKGSENSTSYMIQYMPATSNDWDNASEMIVYDTSVTIINLTPAVSYKARVIAVCIDNTTTDWSSVFVFTMPNIPVGLPYFQNFETDPESITDFSISNNGVNGWYIGSATGVSDPDATDSATHALYISNDNGGSNNYNINIESYAYAVLDVEFDNEPVEWHLSFDYKVAGENNYDFFSVVLAEASSIIPTAGDPNGTALLYHISQNTDWTNFDVILPNVSGTTKRIVFYWRNDNSVGTQPPVALDNISIVSYTCAQPAQLEIADVGEDNVTIDWAEMGNASSWNISYGPTGFTPDSEDGVTIVANNHPFTINNLTPATSYDIYVQAGCESIWAGPLTVTPGSFSLGVTGTDTLITCNLLILDNGGLEGDYVSNSDYYLVLYPANPTDMMMVTGTLRTENTYDYLDIYDGDNTTVLMHRYTGLNQNITEISTTGPLTLYFHSDYSVVNSGFELHAECVHCFPPSNLTVSNESLNEATVTWSGSADSYAIYLSGATTDYFTTSDTTFTFTNLVGSSSYTVQIRSLCGSDSSILSQPVTIFTTCNAITVTQDSPWTENFDNYVGEGAEVLICWETPVTTTFGNGTFPAVYCDYAPSAHSGANSAEFKADGGDINIALLPEFTNDIHDLRLSFWATATSVNYGTMEVGVLTNPSDINTFETVDVCGTPGSRGSTYDNNSGNGNYMGPFDFSNVQATAGRIALRFSSNAYNLSWNLDDFTVELIPACPSPVKTSLSAENIDGHNATITWIDNNPSHNSWIVYYKPTDEETWISVMTSTPSVVLSNLIPETTYDVYVITNCGTTVDNPDATLTYHFTTDVACTPPTDLTLNAIGTDYASISWSGNAGTYNVEYDVMGFTPGTGNTEILSANYIDLVNLTPNTSYFLTVAADCGVDGVSSVATISFVTTMIPVDLPYSTNFTDTSDVWGLNNGTCNNYWMIGEYNNGGALFITNDNTAPGYDISTTSVVTAEKLFTVGSESSFNIGFDVKVGGESTWDYLKVFFAPANESYMASTTVPTYAEYGYNLYAVNFSNYINLTSYTSNPYKFNLTGENTVHVEVEMPNPNEYLTANSTAKLVFLWKNDASSGTQPGAIISNVTVSTNTCPMPYNLMANSISATTANISWNAGGEETQWQLEYGTTGFAHDNGTLVTVSPLPEYTLTNLTSGNTYDVYVRAICSDNDDSPWIGPLTVIPGAYSMPTTGTHTLTSCDLIIYDDGGPINNYSNNSDAVLTIYPEDSTNFVSIQGIVNTESCCDYLKVYDGADTTSPLLGDFKGQNIIISDLISTYGPLTLYFHSDYSLSYSGFELTVTCITDNCITPTDLTVSNITTTSADISWTAIGNEDAWNVEYKDVYSPTWSSIVITSTPFCPLSNLTLNTAYEVRVQAICDDNNQSLWVSTVFYTNCEAITTFPYIEDFEYDGEMPSCWKQEQIWGSNNWTAHSGNYSSSSTAHGGFYNAYFYSNSPIDTQVTRLISPIFDLTSMTNPSLTYWYTQANWGNDQDLLSVYYRTSAASQWQLLTEYTGAVTDWTMDSLLLPNPSATYQIAFVGLADYGYGITLDDITIADAGSGPGPVIVDPTVATTSATNITETTATLNGTITNPDSVTITAKGFEWKATAGGTYVPVTVTGDNLTHNLSNLTPNTSYTYKAFITYNGNTVYGDEVTFTTLEEVVEPCDMPTGLVVLSTTHESISLSWNPNPNVNNWTIQYRPQGGAFSSITATTNNHTITGLAPQTTYEIQVQANCSNGQTSEWSIMVTGTTTVGINEHLLNSISLYPNPAKEVIHVQSTMYNVQMVEVIDVFGKVIKTVGVSDTPVQTSINVSNLANGVYFVRVTTEEGVATKTFVKK